VRAASVGRVRLAGFTLVELIMVLVLAGLIAVFAAPRFFGGDALGARGFRDGTAAYLRYAQKSAIAQRRYVCVRFTATSTTLTIDADRNAATGADGCETGLSGPRGETPGVLAARGSEQYSPVPSVLVFDALGQPSSGLTLQVAGLPGAVVVEPVTGYVRD